MRNQPSADRYESHADRLIREAMERGDFDQLQGEGKPIAGAGKIDDPLWWVRNWIERDHGLNDTV